MMVEGDGIPESKEIIEVYDLQIISKLKNNYRSIRGGRFHTEDQSLNYTTT